MHRARTLAAVVGVSAIGLVGAGCGDDDEETTATSEAAPAASETMAASDTVAASETMAASDTGAASETMAASDTGAAGTIVDVAAGNPDFSVLVEAVQAAGLAETLSGAGPFTVLAPTNAAFEAALGTLGITKEELLANPALGDILTYHVLAGSVGSSDIASEPSRATVQGEPVEIAAEAGSVTVNGSAKVVTADVPASNGVIHVIDAVLLPPTVAEALGAGGGTGTGMEAGTTTG